MLKKLLLSLGTMAAIAAPISSVVACGSKDLLIRIEYTKAPVVQSFKIIDESDDVSKEDIDELRLNLSNGLVMGPESMNLKDIRIQDKDNATYPKDEGDYIKDEVYINTTWLHKLAFKHKDDIAEYLYELIFHEYNHFIDHSYLLNILPTNKNKTEEIYTGTTTRTIQPWPKAFVTSFKDELTYNTDTAYYQGGEIAPGKVSLGSVYNAKDIFDIANGKAVPSFDKLTGNEYRAPINPEVPLSMAKVEGTELAYTYDMDELFARKMQVKNMRYFPTVRGKHDGFGADGYMRSNHLVWPAPYAQDILNYKRGITSDEGQYLSDNPEKSKLDLLMNTTLGIDSQITYLSNAKDSKVKFGGYLPDSGYKYIGYMDGTVLKTIPIHSNMGIYAKAGGLGQTRNYFLTDAFDPSLLINKELFFSNDIKGTRKLTINKVKPKTYGDVTTYRFYNANTNGQFVFDETGKLQTV